MSLCGRGGAVRGRLRGVRDGLLAVTLGRTVRGLRRTVSGAGAAPLSFLWLVAASVGGLAVSTGLVLLRHGGRALAAGGVFKAVAVAVQCEDVDMVGEPIKQGPREAL